MKRKSTLEYGPGFACRQRSHGPVAGSTETVQLSQHSPEMPPERRTYRARFRRFVFHTVLHADDPPHKLALGIAIGVFVTFTPTIGLQMILVLIFAAIFRANKRVGLPIVWISNPATFVPIYYPCYWIGRVILGAENIPWWKNVTPPDPGWWATVVFYWDKTMAIAAPLWLGCLIVATVLAVPSYFFSYFGVRAYRLRRWGQLTPPSAQDKKPTADTSAGDESSSDAA